MLSREDDERLTRVGRGFRCRPAPRPRPRNAGRKSSGDGM